MKDSNGIRKTNIACLRFTLYLINESKTKDNRSNSSERKMYLNEYMKRYEQKTKDHGCNRKFFEVDFYWTAFIVHQ